MGIQTSKRVGYCELKESIPGSFIAEQDFDLFYSLCKIESIRTISTLLHPAQSQLFYVVISGEVQIHLTSPEIKKQKSIIATTYTAGEMIHFFNLPMKTGNVTNFDYGECLKNGDIKLALHFKNTTNSNSSAKVIGIDRRAFERFVVTAKTNTHQLSTFLGLNIIELVQRSPFFKTITPEQVSTSLLYGVYTILYDGFIYFIYNILIYIVLCIMLFIPIC